MRDFGASVGETAEMSRKHFDYELAVLLLVALILRMPGLKESLWFDETYYSRVMLESPNWRHYVFHDVHPPLYPLLMKIWNLCLGESEIRLRLPSLCAGLLSVAICYRLGRQWFGREVGCLAGVLLALAPAHIWYSQENKANMLMLTLCSAVLGLAYESYRNSAGRCWLALGLCSVAALWTHTFSLPYIGAVYLWLGVVCRGSRWKPLLWTSLLVGLASIPMIWRQVTLVKELHHNYLRPFTLGEWWAFLLSWLPFGNTLRDWHGPELFCGLLLLLGIRALLKSSWQTALLIGFYLSLPLLGSLFASVVYPKFYLERNLLAAFPALAWLLALGCLTGGSAGSKRMRVGLLVALQAAALVNLWWLKADSWTVYKPNPDWRGLSAELVQLSRSAGLGPTLVLETTGSPQTVQFYVPGTLCLKAPAWMAAPIPGLVMYSAPDASDYLALMAIIRSLRVERFFVIHELHWSGWTPQLLNRLGQEAAYREDECISFKGFRLHRFRVKPTP